MIIIDLRLSTDVHLNTSESKPERVDEHSARIEISYFDISSAGWLIPWVCDTDRRRELTVKVRREEATVEVWSRSETRELIPSKSPVSSVDDGMVSPAPLLNGS